MKDKPVVTYKSESSTHGRTLVWIDGKIATAWRYNTIPGNCIDLDWVRREEARRLAKLLGAGFEES